jgi:peroxiredoxin
MDELGQLEEQWQEFKKRNVSVVVVSVEDLDDSRAIQEKFPHLVVVSDAKQKLSEAVEVIHPHSAPDGGDTAAPTSFLIDGDGYVKWWFRADRIFRRLSPSEVLAAVDKEMPS